MKRRLTQADADRIRDEYNAWELHKFAAGHETIEQFGARVGISRSRLYELRNNEWVVSTGGHRPSHNGDHESLAPAVRYLTDELLLAKARITELEEELAAVRKRRAKSAVQNTH